jgi:H+/Cl- antiporter ClcA
MTVCSVSSDTKEERILEYPFSKTWVYASAVIAGVSIVFAVLFLIDAEPQEFSFDTFTFMIHPLLLYFIFTSLLTLAMLFLKFYLYSTKEKTSENHFSGSEQEAHGFLRRWLLVIMMLLTVAALFSPLVLWYFLGNLWSFLGISGFVPAVSIPEIILYVYSQRRQNEE